MTVESNVPDDHPESPADADLSLDPIVADRLIPLVDATPPDLWADAARRASAGVDTHADREPSFAVTGSRHPTAGVHTATLGPLGGGVPRRHRSGALRALVAAAVVSVAAGAVVAAVHNGRDGQRIETPAAGLPPGVVTGPALGLDHDAPVGAFTVLYPAGLVVVEADGDVVGHYTGQVPGAVYDPARGTLGRLIGAPEGCNWDGVGSGDALLFCRDANGPNVQGGGLGGISEILASFPAPANGEAPVPGNITAGFPAEGTRTDGGAVLLQVQADCPSQRAFVVDDLRSGPVTGHEEKIRRLDGADATDPEPMAGLSRALGWSRDGSEAYVWRFSGPCAPPLDRPGIYAYRLDGSSRLLVPTSPDAVDVQLITGETPTYGPGAITPLPAFPPTSDSANPAPPAEPFPGWRDWAGPVLADAAGGPATDRELVTAFAQSELGMTNPDLKLSSADLDPAIWIATEGSLSVKLQPAKSYATGPISPEQSAAWQVVWATSFWSDGEDFLSAQVSDDTGRWTAIFLVPSHASTVSATYTLSGRMLEPSETTVLDDGGTSQFRFDLGNEPTEQATLTVRWRNAEGRLVGYQRTTIPPGAFAAS